MKNFALLLKHNRTKIYYAVVTILLLLLFSWAIVTIVPILTQSWHVTDVISQWLMVTLLAIGNASILIWQYVRWRQAESILRLIRDLYRIADEDSDRIIDWRADYAPKTQALINVSNQIAKSTRQIREEERQSERSKDEMITNISHDLRTPLTAIIGYLGLVEMNADVLSATERAKYIHTAYDKSNQMKVLVEDLFAFSQTQAHDAVLNISTLSLGDLFAQLLASYEIEAQEKKIELTQITNPEIIMLEADSDKLARVLMNLITNAMKYGEGATFVKLTAQVKDKAVEIRVINDGAKIPSKDIVDIFGRFYRVESSRNSKTGGTGLGLAIVKGIIEQHQGSVFATSDDELTSFIVTIPLKQH
ncbi:sensor histidine kinase [Leuconostoc rapi]|uniref:sensor histidine kinase n=1 Tax=Leuconostoc rapi TaxID=1406906 RepID=UPI001957E882|nr:HAMP domain-containing sensor histidine kinase [Leuconostoc rapi]MBM7436251.1 signal transduction histidine kinase [Leuconostoc rapi]